MSDCLQRIEEVFAKQAAYDDLLLRIRKRFFTACSHVRSEFERMEAAKDVAMQLYVSILSACRNKGIDSFEAVLGRSISNAVAHHCEESAARKPIDERKHAGNERPRLEDLSEEDYERIVTVAMGLLPNEKDRPLLGMYLDGRTNAEMREADGRSDRTMTRFRREVFPGVLLRAYLRFNSQLA